MQLNSRIYVAGHRGLPTSLGWKSKTVLREGLQQAYADFVARSSRD